jgi:hypothetical protein
MYVVTEWNKFQVRHWYDEIERNREECGDARFVLVGTRADKPKKYWEVDQDRYRMAVFLPLSCLVFAVV